MKQYKLRDISEVFQEIKGELNDFRNLSDEEQKQFEIEQLRKNPSKEKLIEILERSDHRYKENAVKLVKKWCVDMAFNDHSDEDPLKTHFFFVLRKGFDRSKYPLEMIQEIEELIEISVCSMLHKSVAVHFAVSQ